jgi:hypothetical protein
MKIFKSKKIFYIMTTLLGLSFLSAYLQNDGKTLNINGKNLNENLVNFEISKLNTEFPNYKNGYNYLFIKKYDITEDILKEDISIDKDKIKTNLENQYYSDFKEEKDLSNYKENLKKYFKLNPKQYEEANLNQLYFDLFLHSLALTNKNFNNYNQNLEKQINKEIHITYKEKEESKTMITKVIKYSKEKDNTEFYEVLLNSYVSNKKHKIMINEKKYLYTIDKIENRGKNTIEEKDFNGINNKSIINYYF